MVILCRVPRAGWSNLCDDLLSELLRLFLHALLGELALLLGVVEDRTAVLRADIATLTILRGRIMLWSRGNSSSSSRWE
jgi:hypothetical protein